MWSNTVLIFTVFAVLTILLDRVLRLKLDPREPPLISQKIPILGHLAGFLKYGSDYYLRTSVKYKKPIYTFSMPNGRTYVVNSTKLVTAVQRNAKTISFDPILTIVAQRLAGIRGPGLEVLREIESGGEGAHRKLVHSMSPSLTGHGLDLMNIPMLANLQKYTDALATQKDSFSLWKWTRRVISVASTDAVYGPENPYTRDNYEETFWEYESKLTMLLLNVAPQLTARQTYKRREFLAEKMIDYYRRGAWKKGSVMAQTRCQTGLDQGVPIEAIARLEVPGGTGILSNTVPTAFWTLANTVSNPTLLADIRAEVEKVFKIDSSSGKDVWTLDTAEIRTQCPILFSTYQETLRTRASFASPRFVLEDTIIDDRYLLKKGAILQIPSAVLHRETSQWGNEAKEFDPYRFTKKSEIKRSPIAFRAFGGAPALCPGRHFATVEVMCFVGMIVMRYDVEPTSGKWKFPEPNYSNVAASILPPLGDIDVKVRLRKGYENRSWAYKVTTTSEEKSLFALASE